MLHGLVFADVMLGRLPVTLLELFEIEPLPLHQSEAVFPICPCPSKHLGDDQIDGIQHAKVDPLPCSPAASALSLRKQ